MVTHAAMPPRSNASVSGVASPCIDVCRIDPADGWCVGCRRTIDEIAQWSSLGDADRRAVLARVAQRRGEAPRTG
jgi:uncharacterized protein